MPVTDRKPQGAWFSLVVGIAEMAAVEEAIPRAGWEGQECGRGTEVQWTELWAMPSRAAWPWP